MAPALRAAPSRKGARTGVFRNRPADSHQPSSLSSRQIRMGLVTRLGQRGTRNALCCSLPLMARQAGNGTPYPPYLYRGGFFFKHATATEIYTLSLHDALPI